MICPGGYRMARKNLKLDTRILIYPAEQLKKPCRHIYDSEKINFITRTLISAIRERGLDYITANQIGEQFRVCVCSVLDDYIPIVNGVITASTPAMVNHVEKCNSYPGCNLVTERPKVIFVKSHVGIAETEELELVGKDAAIVCHALDHLDGEDTARFLNDEQKMKLTVYMRLLSERLKNGKFDSEFDGLRRP